MKWGVLICIQFVLVSASISQVSMNYLDSNLVATNIKSSAKYIMSQLIYNDTIYQTIVTMAKKDSFLFTKKEKSSISHYYHRVYSAKGRLQKAGWYYYSKEIGIWVYYNDWGKIFQTKTFKNGLENGLRKTFYPNGVLKAEAIYKDGGVNGSFKEYHKNGVVKFEGKKKDDEIWGFLNKYNSKGQLMVKSFYVKGYKEGRDSIFENDTLVKIITYKNGIKNGPVYYFEKGKLVATDIFKKNKLEGKSNYKEPIYSSSLNNGVFSKVDEMPMFKYGEEDMFEFIYSNITYPEEAKTHGIEGQIILKFTIDTSGSVKDIEFISDFLGYGCDEAAYNVVASMPDWIPGKQNGKLVPVYYSLPITFKLF